MPDEFDEEKHPRGADGRFGSGGSLSTWADSKTKSVDLSRPPSGGRIDSPPVDEATARSRLAAYLDYKWGDSKTKEEKRLEVDAAWGRLKTQEKIGSGESFKSTQGDAIGFKHYGEGAGKWYSFGKDVKATHLKTIKLPDADWEGPGRQQVAERLKKEMGELKVPPGHMLVYRVGDGEKEGLAGKQGANINGIAKFLQTQSGKNLGHGEHLSAYLVKRPEKFEDYAGGQVTKWEKR